MVNGSDDESPAPEPETLAAGADPIRPRVWIVLALVVAVVIGAAVFRTRTDDRTQPPPGPPSSVPTAPTGPTDGSTAWPSTLGTGTLYVLDDDGVARIDQSSGLLEHFDIGESGARPNLTAGWGGALLWSRMGGRPPKLIGNGLNGAGLGPRIGSSDSFLPGSDRSVWARTTHRSADRRRTWRLIDESGMTTRSMSLRGSVISDGAGGLFELDGNRVERFGEGRSQRPWIGGVIATGPDGYERLHCLRSTCTTTLYDRASGEEVPLQVPASAPLGVAALSDGNRFAAAQAPGATSQDSTVVQVSVPTSGQDRVSFPVTEGAGAFTWVSDRWLVATQRGGLIMYDAVDDVLVYPELALNHPRQVIRQPA